MKYQSQKIALAYFAVAMALFTVQVSLGSVSYTHLDVYKRQAFTLFTAALWPVFCGPRLTRSAKEQSA